MSTYDDNGRTVDDEMYDVRDDRFAAGDPQTGFDAGAGDPAVLVDEGFADDDAESVDIPAAEAIEYATDNAASWVGAAAGRWVSSLAAIGGRDALLSFRELRVGSLDLIEADSAARNQLIVEGKPTLVSRLFPGELARAAAIRSAKAIYVKSEELRRERGVDAVYLALGLASWTEGYSAKRPNAPILLRRVRIWPRNVAQNDFVLEVTDASDDAMLNPVLLDTISTVLGIRVDPTALLDDDGRMRYRTVVAALREAAPAHVVDGFTVMHRASISIFSAAAARLQDEISNDAHDLIAHPLVRALAGDHPGDTALPPATAVDAEPVDDLLILDADDAQTRAISLAAGGGNLAIVPVPGSGATQTLANIVAIAADRGEKVLVTASPAAPRNDLMRMLGSVGLADLALDVARAERSRESMWGQVARVLAKVDDPRRQLPAGARAAGHGVDVTAGTGATAALERLVRGTMEARAPWGVSLSEALEIESRTGAEVRTSVRLTPAALQALTPSRLKAVEAALAEFVSSGALLLGPETTPWYGARPQDADQADSLLRTVRNLANPGLVEARTLAVRVAVESGFEAPTSPQMLIDQAELLKAAAAVERFFSADVWGQPLEDFIAATADRQQRRGFGANLGFMERRAFRAQAAAMVRDQSLAGDFERIHRRLQDALTVRRQWVERSHDGRLPVLVPEAAGLIEVGVWLRDSLAAVERLHPAADLRRDDFEALRTRLEELGADAETIARMPRIQQLISIFAEAEIGALVKDLRDRAVAGAEDVTAETALEMLRYCRAASLVHAVREQDETLRTFDARRFEGYERVFRAADLDSLRTNVENLWQRHLGRIRNSLESLPSQAILVRAWAARPASAPTLEQVMRDVPELMMDLFPVWVAPPLSACVVPPQHRFDLVVVDCAQMMRSSEAVGALRRGRRVVVIGDRMQVGATPWVMSPDPDAEPAPVVGPMGQVEPSVYEALADHLPKVGLTHVYRVDDERLSAFSSAQAYGGTATAVPGSGRVNPIAFYAVEQPAGSRGQEESVDAEIDTIIALVEDHARTRPNETLGVVCLSEVHARKLDLAVREALLRAPGLDAFFAEDRDEPFYVTPANRVAGGVRDHIIVSVGFGRAMDGRVLYKFGALHQSGGDRWMTTAMTRSRARTTIVSALRADDLEERRLASGGARMFKDLLAYAESGGLAVPTRSGVQVLRPPVAATLEAEVAAHLERRGYDVVLGLGWTKPGIAVAMAHPKRAGRFVLAVDTDANAGPSCSLRERFRLRPEELQRAGWATHRVWTAEWAADPKGAIDRVVAAFDAAVREADACDLAMFGDVEGLLDGAELGAGALSAPAPVAAAEVAEAPAAVDDAKGAHFGDRVVSDVLRSEGDVDSLINPDRAEPFGTGPAAVPADPDAGLVTTAEFLALGHHEGRPEVRPAVPTNRPLRAIPMQDLARLASWLDNPVGTGEDELIDRLARELNLAAPLSPEVRSILRTAVRTARALR